jgi:thioredoxin reductase (NADPH)
MNDTPNIYDVVIIGGGPAGLTAGQYTSRSKLKTLILDKSKTAGALAFTSKIENYPGLIKPISGKELLDIFRNQAIEFGAEYIEAQVVGARLTETIKEIYTMDGVYKAKTVIIATGAMGRKPSFKGEEELLGRGVSYCAICDAAFFRGKTVCVLGSSEEAVKEAGLLTRFAAKVYLISPQSKVTAGGYEDVLKIENLTILLNHQPIEIRGEDAVKDIILKNRDKDSEIILPMDGVFVYLHGSKPIVDFLNQEVTLGDEGCILTNEVMETSIDGVFSAGDVSCVEVRQVVIATGHGCMAALSAEKYIHNRKKRKQDWSKSG